MDMAAKRRMMNDSVHTCVFLCAHHCRMFTLQRVVVVRLYECVCVTWRWWILYWSMWSVDSWTDEVTGEVSVSTCYCQPVCLSLLPSCCLLHVAIPQSPHVPLYLSPSLWQTIFVLTLPIISYEHILHRLFTNILSFVYNIASIHFYSFHPCKPFMFIHPLPL